ncbi:hypothetical protein RND71_038504 [Anisodus tanguticus]|uniref:Uncharacterized protein n=1 Tax=Anisodus tanguticus TaxID=243964 RepID=A0AAE1R034_9SOLA|nr:hypothetical protein RND71_038504 [Anisodus tanguticus]
MEDGINDIANFGFSNSRDQEVEEKSQENVGEISEDSKGGDKGKEEGGGLINHIISNLMSPRVGEANNKEKNNIFDVKDEDEKEDIACKVEEKSGNESGGGGLINNLISIFFQPTENAVGNQENNSGEEQKNDAVPATDEASILIHSIVHD